MNVRFLSALYIYTYPLLSLAATVHEIAHRSGKTQSPNYPGDYGDDQDTTWKFITKPGYIFTLKFAAFDIEDSYEEDKGSCVYDYLEIIENGKTKCKFCGNSANKNPNAPELEKEIKSEGHELTVRFVSDYSNEDPKPTGFEFEYQITDRDECREKEQEVMFAYEDWDEIIYCNHKCHNTPGRYYCSCDDGFELHANGHTCTNKCKGKVLTNDNGVITTSRYPEKYSKLADCEWVIKGKHGISVDIRFVDKFSVEEHYDEGCVYDWIQYQPADGAISDRICGQTKPNGGQWIKTNSREVKIFFQSDMTEEEAGFKLEWRFNRVECRDKPSAPAHGSIRLPKSSYVFEDLVEFVCDKGYYTTEPKTMKCMSDGKWRGSPPTCKEIVCPTPDYIINRKNVKPIPIPTNLKYGAKLTVECKSEFFVMVSGAASWKCGHDAKWVPNSKIIAPNKDNNLPECKPDCGKKGNARILSGGSFRRRRSLFNEAVRPDGGFFQIAIVRGKPAKYGEWPWMALVDLFGSGLEANEFCGGSLISGRTVITAAHCTQRTYKSSIKVFLGASERLHTDVYVQEFGLSDLIEHPNYSSSTFDNDIAVLILDKSVVIGKYARPICLPRSAREIGLPDLALTDPDNHQETGIIAGWGITESGRLATELNYARIPPIERSQCKKLFAASKPPEFGDMKITDNMMCAGYPGAESKGRDSCQGDSGGPLSFKDTVINRYFLHGVVSFGSTENCGKGTFGIYTKVANYISWIDNYIQE